MKNLLSSGTITLFKISRKYFKCYGCVLIVVKFFIQLARLLILSHIIVSCAIVTSRTSQLLFEIKLKYSTEMKQLRF